MSDNFNESLEEAMPMDGPTGTAIISRHNFRKGAEWAREWVCNRHKLFEEYEHKIKLQSQAIDKLMGALEECAIEENWRKFDPFEVLAEVKETLK